MTDSLRLGRILRNRKPRKSDDGLNCCEDMRIEEIPKRSRPMSLFLSIGNHGITEYIQPEAYEEESEFSDSDGGVLSDMDKLTVLTPASHVVSSAADPADPFKGAKQNTLDRRRRPWTIMVPRNEAQSHPGREEGRHSLRLLNTRDSQVMDIEGGEAFLETLRQHLEGKGDAAGLIVLPDDD